MKARPHTERLGMSGHIRRMAGVTALRTVYVAEPVHRDRD
jgi:hypothetical protein